LSMTARSVDRPLIMALGASAAGTASAAASRWQVQAIANNGWQLTLTRLRSSYRQTPPTQGWQVFAAAPQSDADGGAKTPEIVAEPRQLATN